MSRFRYAASATIEAPPRRLYAVLADYHDGHARILPRPPFTGLEVEAGGTGAGTVLRVHMRVMGRARSFRSVVSEPEPGRVLVETNDTGYVTTFTVDPLGPGDRSRVTIATEKEGRGGPAGLAVRWIMGRILRPIFARELERLAEVVDARIADPATG